MSALPPKADIRCCDQHVRLVPKADIAAASLAGNSVLNSGKARIKFVAHLCCLGSNRCAAEQLLCLFSRNVAIEVEGTAFTSLRPVWRRKIHRYNCN